MKARHPNRIEFSVTVAVAPLIYFRVELGVIVYVFPLIEHLWRNGILGKTHT